MYVVCVCCMALGMQVEDVGECVMPSDVLQKFQNVQLVSIKIKRMRENTMMKKRKVIFSLKTPSKQRDAKTSPG